VARRDNLAMLVREGAGRRDADADADVDDDEDHLAAYNAYLARINGPGRQETANQAERNS
jgi:hypothetical protein